MQAPIAFCKAESGKSPGFAKWRRRMAFYMGMRTPDGIDWGKVPPERRTPWGRFLVRMRYENGKDDPVSGKRVPLTQAEVLRRLETLGRQVDPSSYSQMETGRRDVATDLQAVFVRLYGRGPEDQPDEPAGAGETAPDLGRLLAALTSQTEAMTALVTRVADDDRMDRLERQMERLTEAVLKITERMATWEDGGGAAGAPPAGPAGRQRSGGGPKSHAEAR